MPSSVIVGGARTPIGKLSGALKSLPAVELGAVAIRAGLEGAGITNISSVMGSSGNIGQANYAAAKFGILGLTKSLALETTTRKGITVNAVTPGFITTDMTAAVPAEAPPNVIEKIPAGRLGEADEVARVVEFLADPDSAYITRQTHAINGGLYM